MRTSWRTFLACFSIDGEKKNFFFCCSHKMKFLVLLVMVNLSVLFVQSLPCVHVQPNVDSGRETLIIGLGIVCAITLVLMLAFLVFSSCCWCYTRQALLLYLLSFCSFCCLMIQRNYFERLGTDTKKKNFIFSNRRRNFKRAYTAYRTDSPLVQGDNHGPVLEEENLRDGCRACNVSDVNDGRMIDSVRSQTKWIRNGKTVI